MATAWAGLAFAKQVGGEHAWDISQKPLTCNRRRIGSEGIAKFGQPLTIPTLRTPYKPTSGDTNKTKTNDTLPVTLAHAKKAKTALPGMRVRWQGRPWLSSRCAVVMGSVNRADMIHQWPRFSGWCPPSRLPLWPTRGHRQLAACHPKWACIDECV